ncbi:MAG: 2-C-methyl-D-erythritol 4-phosphate cytidylyltransferase [Nitrospinota bacterium]
MQPDSSDVVAIIPSAGSGVRLDIKRKKQFLKLASSPLLAETIHRVSLSKKIGTIVITAPPDDIDQVATIVDSLLLTNRTLIVPGGKSRQESVYRGLQSVSSNPAIILIHDGVRPFVEPSMIDATIEMARLHSGAVTAIKSSDAVRIVKNKKIASHINRDELHQIQTPQAFQYQLLLDAHLHAIKHNISGDDDSYLVSQIGVNSFVLEGSRLNFKITTREDLELARAISIYNK